MNRLASARRSGALRKAVPIAGAIVAVVLIAGCGGSDSAGGSLSQIPGTNTLSTEASTPTTTTTSSTAASLPGTSAASGGPTILQSIRAADDVDSSQYRSGATNSSSPTQQTSQYHFSTPSLDAACSSTSGDTPTLVCVGGGAAKIGQGCSTTGGQVVVLATSGARPGSCADAAQVLTRSQILPYGNSISFGDFVCAAKVSGLYCLQTSTNAGFAMSNGNYRSVVGAQQMPGA